MDIWSIVLTSVLGVITAVLTFVLQRKISENKQLKEKKKTHEKALENGLVCILRKHLMDEHKIWMEEGYITSKALESGLLMYQAYKGLGGNGMIDHMEEEIQELPIKD